MSSETTAAAAAPVSLSKPKTVEVSSSSSSSSSTSSSNPHQSAVITTSSSSSALSKFQCPLLQTCLQAFSGQQHRCPFGHHQPNLQPLPRLLCVDHLLFGGCPNRVVRQARGLERCSAGYHPRAAELEGEEQLAQYLRSLPPVTPLPAGSSSGRREGIDICARLLAGPRRTPADEDIEEGAVSTTETSDGDFTVAEQRQSISRRYRSQRDLPQNNHLAMCRWWTVGEHQAFVRGFINGCMITLLVILGLLTFYLGYRVIAYGRGGGRRGFKG
ncbi:hypothetical protein TYRP_016165 [Tyrophagus putrescentiae]|nr:hypothetical protein TYRP_016165 [Tyrophagus putrescentiae]